MCIILLPLLLFVAGINKLAQYKLGSANMHFLIYFRTGLSPTLSTPTLIRTTLRCWRTLILRRCYTIRGRYWCRLGSSYRRKNHGRCLARAWDWGQEWRPFEIRASTWGSTSHGGELDSQSNPRLCILWTGVIFHSVTLYTTSDGQLVSKSMLSGRKPELWK